MSQNEFRNENLNVSKNKQITELFLLYYLIYYVHMFIAHLFHRHFTM